MVNIYKLKFTLLQQEILRFLFMHSGKSFNARDLSLGLDVSLPAIIKAIPKLEDANLIIVKKDKRYSIELNADNPEVIGLKRADNLKVLYESGFIDYISKQYAGSTIILFGSFSTGEDTYDSDIDLAIIGIASKKVDMSKYEKILGKEIVANFYPSFSKIDKPLLNNILKGITLKGSVNIERI